MNGKIIDSSVWIDFLRGMPKAIQFIEKNKNEIFLTTIILMELFAGASNKNELIVLKKDFSKYVILPENQSIIKLASEIFYKYNLSAGIGILDAIIAASGLSYNLPIVTKNIKHFKFVPGIKLMMY